MSGEILLCSANIMFALHNNYRSVDGDIERFLKNFQ